ncbi:MAG: hypothetical protein ABJG68_04440 [Crocinitomicaceae bacterium]
MKRLVYILPFYLIFSCDAPEQTDSTEKYDLDDTIYYEDDDTLTDDSEAGVIYTAEGAVDGPDAELWIFQPGEWEGEVTDPAPDEFDVLHVIPMGNDENNISNDMSYVLSNGFQLWGTFEKHTGPVYVYYERSKNTLAAMWDAVEGKPEGPAKVFTPSGEIFVENVYKNGKLVESPIYPYSVDWTFAQAESKLWIKDPDAKENENGNPTYKISYSIREQEPGDNKLVQIMEKESFGNPFQINDEVFTGTLLAYENPPGIDYEIEYFELNFKDGMLHGDVKVYSWYMGLKLHEIFVDGDLDSTVFVLDESQMDGLAKPIIYLYPEEETEVSVKLELAGDLTHTYPKYEDGWKVTAKPDGTLLDENNKEYYALYWEGNNEENFHVNEGFVVPGENTAEFLEASLDMLGLNRREANEFIVFWMPILEDNPYNLIHFSTDEYEEMAKLDISPKPETMIRVMMVYKPLQEPIELKMQNLSEMKKERKGFTLVEWGGSLLKTTKAL